VKGKKWKKGSERKEEKERRKKTLKLFGQGQAVLSSCKLKTENQH